MANTCKAYSLPSVSSIPVRKNTVLYFSSVSKKRSGLLFAKVLQLFRIKNDRGTKNQNYTFLQYTTVKYPIPTANETLGTVSVT